MRSRTATSRASACAAGRTRSSEPAFGRATVHGAMAPFEPKDPAFAARIRESFVRQKVMGLIGAELTRVEPGRVEIELLFRDDLTQQHGFFHAGIIGTIADSAGGYAA